MKLFESFYRIIKHYPIMLGLIIIVFVCYDLTQYRVLSPNLLALNDLSFIEPIRLLGYSVLHIDLSHLIMNLFSVFVLTPYLFKTHQIQRQVIFFLASPIIVGALCIIISPPSNSIGAIGYSGAVFAMIGALWEKNSDVFNKLSLMAFLSTVFWWVTDVPIYHAAHILGYIVGVAFGVTYHYLNINNLKS